MNKNQFTSYVKKLTKEILTEQIAPKKTFKLIRYNNIKKLVTAINSSLVSTQAKGNMLRCVVDLQKAINNDRAIYAKGTYIINPEIFIEKLQRGLTIMGIGVDLKETTLSKVEVRQIFSKHKPSEITVSSSYNYVMASWFDPKKIKESVNEAVDNNIIAIVREIKELVYDEPPDLSQIMEWDGPAESIINALKDPSLLDDWKNNPEYKNWDRKDLIKWIEKNDIKKRFEIYHKAVVVENNKKIKKLENKLIQKFPGLKKMQKEVEYSVAYIDEIWKKGKYYMVSAANPFTSGTDYEMQLTPKEAQDIKSFISAKGIKKKKRKTHFVQYD